MSRRSLLIALLSALCACFVGVGSAVAQSPTVAPSPTATTTAPASLPAPTGLRAAGRMAPGPATPVRLFVIWNGISDVNASYQLDRSLTDDESTRNFQSHATLAAGARLADGTFEHDEGPAGRIAGGRFICYRVRAVAGANLGPYSTETCIGPIPSTGPGATPAPGSTPAPPQLTLRIEGDILDDRGFPIPPEQRRLSVAITWSLAPGFSGTYELERSRVGPDQARAYERVAVLPAAEAIGGRLTFTEPFTLSPLQSCYRARAVQSGVAGAYADEVCTVRVPTTGPGVDATSTAVATPGFSRTPLPPATGTSVVTGSDEAPAATIWIVGLIGGAGALVAGALARRKR